MRLRDIQIRINENKTNFNEFYEKYEQIKEKAK